MAPKRILQITSVLNCGGIENLILNVFRRIDREKIVFDFLVIREDMGILEEEVKSLGGKIYKLPSMKSVGYRKFKKNLDEFFKENKEYTIVHSHVNAWSGLILKYAKKHGIPTRIAHSHSAYPKYSLFSKIIKNRWKKNLPYVATDFFACSTPAKNWLFGKNSNCTIVKNGIDLQKYAFSENVRKKVRKELEIEDKFVLINTGRFSKEKNQIFLIKLLSEILKTNKNAVLIYVGEGKTKKFVADQSKKLGVYNKIIFTGFKENVSDYLNASDVYIAPSLFEGFGTALLEAQCNSIPCIASDVFPKEAIINTDCKILPLSAPISTWCNEVLNQKRKSSTGNILAFSEHSKLHINKTVDYLSKFYLSH